MHLKHVQKLKLNRLTALALVFIMLTGMLSVEGASASVVNDTDYYDYEYDESGYQPYWAQEYLDDMLDKGIMTGNSNGNLNPSDLITRAEFATMTNRALGFVGPGDANFNDVAEDDWFYSDVTEAGEIGYLQGVANRTAAPLQTITRESAITMLGRALKLPTDGRLTNEFTDQESVSPWSTDYVNAAVSKGIISGYADGSFGPRNSITRAEVAKIMSTLTGTIISEGSQSRLDYVDGNVTITSTGGGLKDTVIEGDLYITDGVGTGYILLDNVTVKGQVIVSGAGEANSGNCDIILRDCDINELILDTPEDRTVSLSTQGNTIVANTLVKESTFLDSSNSSGTPFANVEISTDPGELVTLSGSFANVTVTGAGNVVNLGRGNVVNLTIGETAVNSSLNLDRNTNVDNLFTDTAANVTGDGTITHLTVSTEGTVVSQEPEDAYVRPGVTARVNDRNITYTDSEIMNELPEIMNGYPKLSNLDTTSVTSSFKTNKSGTLYWIVVKKDTSGPNASQLINPRLLGTTVKSGNSKVADNVESSVRITGLTAGTDYTLYAMMQDIKEQNSAIKVADFTTIDTSVPRITTSRAEAQTRYNDNGTTSFNAVLTLTVSKDATVYYAVIRNGRAGAPGQQAAAPTASELIAQSVTADAKGRKEFRATVSSVINIYELDENTSYTAYAVAVDDSNRESAVARMNFNTNDNTPPVMVSLKTDAGNNNVRATLVTDEDCSRIYWGIYYLNTPIVDTIETNEVSENGLIWYESDNSRELVMNGTGAVQSANNLTSRANTAANLNIGNLEQERYYNLYVVLEDSSGNRSVVYKVSAHTDDKSDPTARLTYSASNGENPHVGNAENPTYINIVFSEEVYGVMGEITRELTSGEWDSTQLSNLIKLYRGDATWITDPSRELPINWEYVERTLSTATQESPEHTVFSMSTASSGNTALNLNTGETYTFVFTYSPAGGMYIEDRSGNAMRQKVTGSPNGGDATSVTLTFTTVNPSISMTAPAGVGSTLEIKTSSEDSATTHYIDTSFKITATEASIGASDEQKYDLYVSSEQSSVVNVFELTDDGWKVVAENIVLSPVPSSSTTAPTIERATSLTAANVGRTVYSSDYDSKKFNTMQTASFSSANVGNYNGSVIIAFEVVQYNSSAVRAEWDGSMNMNLFVALENADYLARKANSPSNTSISVITLNYTQDRTAFTDSVPPVVRVDDENVSAADSEIEVYEDHFNAYFTADKNVTLYWAAIPNGLSDTYRRTTEQMYEYIQNRADPNGVYNTAGVPILALQGKTLVTIGDDTTGTLEPDVNYTVYFVAVSSTGNLTQYDSNYSQLCQDYEGNNQYFTRQTKALQPPEFQYVVVSNREYVAYDQNNSDDEKITFQVQTDSRAKIFWTVVPAANNDRYLEAIGDVNGNNGDNGEIRRPTNKTSTLIVQSGNLNTASTVNSSGYYSASVTITGLVKNTTYYFYAVAGNFIDDAILSTNPAYVSFDEFQLIDTEIPKITGVTFDSWIANPYDLNAVLSNQYPDNKATVTVSFDRPLYYYDNGAVIDVTNDTAGVTDASEDAGIWYNVSPSTYTVYNSITGAETQGSGSRTYSVDVRGSTMTTNQSLTFTVSNINHLGGNETVTLRSQYSICNSSGTIAGTFILRLETASADFARNNPTMTSTCTCTASIINGATTTSSRTASVSRTFSNPNAPEQS